MSHSRELPSPRLATAPRRGLALILDPFLPRRIASPRESFQARFVVSASLLAILAALPSLAVAIAQRLVPSAVFIGAFTIVLLAQLVAIRLGAPMRIIVWASLALLGTFLTIDSLVTAELDPEQLQWQILLPLSALVLVEPRAPGHRSAAETSRPVLLAAAIAIMLGGLIIALHHLGLTFGAPLPPRGNLDAAVNFCVFMGAVGGMLYVYDLSMRETMIELETLRQLLAVCAWCKKIRDDATGGWVPLDQYVATHYFDVTHGICKECAARFANQSK